MNDKKFMYSFSSVVGTRGKSHYNSEEHLDIIDIVDKPLKDGTISTEFTSRNPKRWSYDPDYQGVYRIQFYPENEIPDLDKVIKYELILKHYNKTTFRKFSTMSYLKDFIKQMNHTYSYIEEVRAVLYYEDALHESDKYKYVTLLSKDIEKQLFDIRYKGIDYSKSVFKSDNYVEYSRLEEFHKLRHKNNYRYTCTLFDQSSVRFPTKNGDVHYSFAETCCWIDVRFYQNPDDFRVNNYQIGTLGPPMIAPNGVHVVGKSNDETPYRTLNELHFVNGFKNCRFTYEEAHADYSDYGFKLSLEPYNPRVKWIEKEFIYPYSLTEDFREKLAENRIRINYDLWNVVDYDYLRAKFILQTKDTHNSLFSPILMNLTKIKRTSSCGILHFCDTFDKSLEAFSYYYKAFKQLKAYNHPKDSIFDHYLLLYIINKYFYKHAFSPTGIFDYAVRMTHLFKEQSTKALIEKFETEESRKRKVIYDYYQEKKVKREVLEKCSKLNDKECRIFGIPPSANFLYEVKYREKDGHPYIEDVDGAVWDVTILEPKNFVPYAQIPDFVSNNRNKRVKVKMNHEDFNNHYVEIELKYRSNSDEEVTKVFKSDLEIKQFNVSEVKEIISFTTIVNYKPHDTITNVHRKTVTGEREIQTKLNQFNINLETKQTKEKSMKREQTEEAQASVKNFKYKIDFIGGRGKMRHCIINAPSYKVALQRFGEDTETIKKVWKNGEVSDETVSKPTRIRRVTKYIGKSKEIIFERYSEKVQLLSEPNISADKKICVSLKKDDEIVQVERIWKSEAEQYLKDGWTYSSKSIWKKFVRKDDDTKFPSGTLSTPQEVIMRESAEKLEKAVELKKRIHARLMAAQKRKFKKNASKTQQRYRIRRNLKRKENALLSQKQQQIE